MRHERHEYDTNDASATRVRHKWHECNTTATRVLNERNECDTSYTSDASGTRVRNFDFDNDTSENIFSCPYICYMANERLQGQEQFYSKSSLLEMPRSHAKMHLKSAPHKLNFVMAKAISKSYTYIVAANALACSRIITHSSTISFPIKNHFI